MEEEKTFKDFNDPLTERTGKEAVWVDKEVHQLLWEYKVKHGKKSIGEVAGYFIKLGIIDAIRSGNE